MASQILITPEFRMSFPALVKPQQYQGKGDPRFSVEMLFQPDDMNRFKRLNESDGSFEDVSLPKICSEIAKEEWPSMTVKEAVEQGVLGWPIGDGDKKAAKREAKGKKSDYYKGLKIISTKANTEYPPRLYYVENGETKQIGRGMESEEAKANQLFTGGNYAYAEINVKATETPQGSFVTCYLNSIRFTRAGERLGGMSMMDRFEGVQGGESDHNPMDGSDDDIPL